MFLLLRMIVLVLVFVPNLPPPAPPLDNRHNSMLRGSCAAAVQTTKTVTSSNVIMFKSSDALTCSTAQRNMKKWLRTVDVMGLRETVMPGRRSDFLSYSCRGYTVLLYNLSFTLSTWYDINTLKLVISHCLYYTSILFTSFIIPVEIHVHRHGNKYKPLLFRLFPTTSGHNHSQASAQRVISLHHHRCHLSTSKVSKYI